MLKIFAWLLGSPTIHPVGPVWTVPSASRFKDVIPFFLGGVMHMDESAQSDDVQRCEASLCCMAWCSKENHVLVVILHFQVQLLSSVHLERSPPPHAHTLTCTRTHYCFHLPSPLSSYLYKPNFLWNSSWSLCRTSFSERVVEYCGLDNCRTHV
jgi:hypothetical protein